MGVLWIGRRGRSRRRRQLPAAEAAPICAALRRTGWEPRLIAGETGHPHAAVWRCLRPAGLSRLPRARHENASLAQLLTDHDIRHLLIPARRPQVNGKVERYQQTFKREWARRRTYRSSDHRVDGLTYWL